MKAINKIKNIIILIIMAIILSACANMPTPVSQITGAYVSSLKYEKYNCRQLQIELDHLNRRESQLALAQEQRIKSSDMQAFWLGYGQGDGIEASELAIVRGEKEAVIKAMSKINCGKTEDTTTNP